MTALEAVETYLRREVARLQAQPPITGPAFAGLAKFTAEATGRLEVRLAEIRTGAELSAEEMYGALLIMQDDRCGGCGIEDSEVNPGDLRRGRPLRLDHDHETGLIRGLLCHNCNVQEGQARPHAGTVAYLADPPAQGLGWIYPGFVRPYTPDAGRLRSVARRLHVPYERPKG